MLEPRFRLGRGILVSAELSRSRESLYRELMSITVLLFASYADALGVPSVSLDLPVGATVNDVLADIAARPGGNALPAHPLVAVNQRYAAPGTPVSAGDEVAIIPPVSGG